MDSSTQPIKVVDLHMSDNRQNSCVGNIEFDIDAYHDALIAEGATPEQREAFLKALWVIIVAFIDLGYGVHPTQRVPLPDDLNGEIVATVDKFFKKSA